jgi:hypothetical protein
MVLELGGLDFEPRPHLFPLRLIPTYRSAYGGACVSHTSGPLEQNGGILTVTQ